MFSEIVCFLDHSTQIGISATVKYYTAICGYLLMLLVCGHEAIYDNFREMSVCSSVAFVSHLFSSPSLLYFRSAGPAPESHHAGAGAEESGGGGGSSGGGASGGPAG